ncbi:MAG: 50S ribosome-binding GTPase [Phycisphaeraceae bacterium]|nr:50S ribosome-binding GTPase [Phycisphaeraceae bacterium]
MNPHDTIVAASSPPGRSLRGLIRLSGPSAPTISHCLTQPASFSGRSQIAAPAPTACISAPGSAGGYDVLTPHLSPARIYLKTSSPPLPVLLAFFPAPHSYTGQDVVEFQLPGQPALLERLLHRCCQLGARLAEPGEFTFRAFLNRKMDLTTAEGVAATIAAQSDSQLAAAQMLRQGRLGSAATQLVDQITTLLALVEAGIDFTDQDDVVPITPPQIHQQLQPILDELNNLLAHARPWGELQALPRVVLLGPPSCGKSTLFNTLLRHPRALTSPLPGTTRDVLQEPLLLRDQSGRTVEVMLVDMAGIDDPLYALDHQAQQAARQAVAQADLLLLLDDGDPHPDCPALRLSQQVLSQPAAPPFLAVRTKADLLNSPPSPSPDRQPLHVSAHTGHNLPLLHQAILDRLADRLVSPSADRLALQPRHEQSLRQAQQSLRDVMAILNASTSPAALARPELVAGGLRSALNDLACLGGQMTPDDVLGRVFATFCIGK